MDGSKLHEYQCKLHCLTIEAEYVIETLLGFYAVQSNIAKTNNITDPNEAFTAIVTHCHNNSTLKNVKKLSYPDYNQKCFDLNIPIQVKTIINIEELDITISYDFLRNLDIFPTCKDSYKKTLKCKNLTGNHDNVCCNLCMTCNNCLLTSLPCKSVDIIEAIVFIKDFRNFTAHLKFSLCERMEKGDFSCIKITDCRTWNDVLIKYMDVIKIVLQYLRIHLGISIDSRCHNLDIIINKNNEVYWNIYNTSSMNRIMRENVAILNSKDNIIKKTFEVNLAFKKAGFWGFLSSVASRFISHDTPDIDDPFMLQVYTGYREAVEKIVFTELKLADNSGKFEIGNIGVIPPSQLELLSICMSINIEFRNEPPECYKDTHSIESQSLRKQIKNTVAEVIRDVLKLDIKVKCTGWRFSSLHISFDIFKLDKQQWSNEDRTVICSFLEEDEIMLRTINKLLMNNVGNMYYFDIATSSDIRIPDTLTMEVDIQVHEEEILDQITNAWPTISSKLTNLPSDDLFNGKCLEASGSNNVDCIEADFVKIEEGKGFY